MNEDLHDRIDRLESFGYLQSADISALLNVLLSLAAEQEDAFLVERLKKEFLDTRKVLLQTQLEDLEKRDPGKAAKFQKMIDDSCKIFPYGYE